MANWSDLKAAVASIVKTNGNKEITGQLLQNVLNNIISNVGLNSSFAGIATPETNPGAPDGNVFYLATTEGTYSNFNGIVINSGEAVILEWKGSWVKKDSGFTTNQKLSELEENTNQKLSELGSDVRNNPVILFNFEQGQFSTSDEIYKYDNDKRCRSQFVYGLIDTIKAKEGYAIYVQGCDADYHKVKNGSFVNEVNVARDYARSTYIVVNVKKINDSAISPEEAKENVEFTLADYLNKIESVLTSYEQHIPLENGNINTADGQNNEDSYNQRCRTSEFYSAFELQTNEGFIIQRVNVYNKDKTFVRNIVVNDSYYLVEDDNDNLYRITFSKTDSTQNISASENIIKYLYSGILKDIMDSTKEASALKFVNVGNLYDSSKALLNTILDENGGKWHDNTSYTTSEMMPVESNSLYIASATMRRIAEYDANKNHIRTIESINQLTTGTKAKYLVISIGNKIYDFSIQIASNPLAKKRMVDEYGNVYAVEKIAEKSAKNIIIFGDSSTAGSEVGGTNWFNRMCQELGFANYQNFAVGGQTILNRDGVDANYLKRYILSAIEWVNSTWGGKVDVIMLQIGGNDRGYMAQKGSMEDAFSSYNYLDYASDKTIYGSLRYCLELLRRTYPNALIVMGTVFGRISNDYDGGVASINEIITDCCNAMKIQMIDGAKYMGFSPYTEITSPYYNDANPGIKDDRTNLSRDNQAYNYIEVATGAIVPYEIATLGGEVKDGYAKRFGLYTYDGVHQTQMGENKVKEFMKNELKRLCDL